ncbi:MAG: glycine dehydrogenase, partial [Gammaproteobacteria bacterium SHHR-1]
TAATIHLSLLGFNGLANTAAACHANTQQLGQLLCQVKGIEPLFSGAMFHEQALRLPLAVGDVLRALAAHNVLGGYDLSHDYPELGKALLVCATEKRSTEEMQHYQQKLERIINARAPCPVRPKF